MPAILFVTFLLGFFLDWVEITLVILPLVAPVVQSLGFVLVWFTIFLCRLSADFFLDGAGRVCALLHQGRRAHRFFAVARSGVDHNLGAHRSQAAQRGVRLRHTSPEFDRLPES